MVETRGTCPDSSALPLHLPALADPITENKNAAATALGQRIAGKLAGLCQMPSELQPRLHLYVHQPGISCHSQLLTMARSKKPAPDRKRTGNAKNGSAIFSGGIHPLRSETGSVCARVSVIPAAYVRQRKLALAWRWMPGARPFQVN